ncbi:MAG: helix-turn-helix transcriptional regulator [Fusicatenibacter sp.]|nr:helix-turn-helix transcriptional regulator [Lachnospiraceae bacterium]MDY2938633.1 helix-turn-helix transcriptional regulator [Fusicatenibacter sp.]
MRDTDVILHVQELCKERSWTYYRLAKEADIPYSTLNNMMNRNNIPTIPTLQKLCDAFGITLSDFFQDESENSQLTQPQKEMIELYNRLSLEKKKILKAYMKGLLMEV